MIFPLIQLIILGNAFGGKITDARVGVVDQDGGTQSLKVREALNAVEANSRTFRPGDYCNSDQQAMEDVRTGRLPGLLLGRSPASSPTASAAGPSSTSRRRS